MNKEKDKSYSDFFSDTLFIEWRLAKTEELDSYWENYVKENPSDKEALQKAIFVFKSVKLNDIQLSQADNDYLQNRIRQSIQDVKYKKRIKYYWSVAACSLLLITSSLFFATEDKPEIDQNTITGTTLPSKDIEFITGSKTVQISKNVEIKLTEEGKVSVTEEGESSDLGLSLSKEQNNRLIVPYGKRSTLQLADGTKVWLNSGSEIEFPSKFEGNKREISIKGEIYIDVTKQDNMPFYVNTPRFNVRVYGTKFNISSYADNIEQSVVLVNGKVEIELASNTRILKPGEQFLLQGKDISLKKVNTNEHISWINGIFIFDKATISEILKKIGRYYNVTFDSNSSNLLNRTCSGKLFLSDDMEQVMEILGAISNTSFKRVGNTLYINDLEHGIT